LRTLRGHSQPVTGLDVIPLSGNLVSCSTDCTIRVWNYLTGAVLQTHAHFEEFKCLALRADTDEIIAGTEQDNILRFQAGEEVGTASARTPAGRVDRRGSELRSGSGRAVEPG